MREVSFTKWKAQMISLARSQKTSVCVAFELTPRCNLDCKMCYIHNQESNTQVSRELSTAEWKRIFNEAYDCGLLFATLTGGECLIREDFKELYLHLWNKGVFMTVFTNGLLLNEAYVSFFKTYRPRKIQISLYGSSEEGYLKVTGHQGFEKAVTAIRSLRTAGINVQVVTTPSRYMGEDYIKILRFCKEQGFPLRMGELLLAKNRDNPAKDDYSLTIEETASLAVERASLYGALTPIKSTPEPCGPMTEDPQQGLTCNAGVCLASVMWDGVMYPCPNAMVGGGASLREMSYADAWNHTVEAAAEVLHGAECVGCPYDKVCPKCPAMRLTGLHTGHCNPEVCELTRQLVAAGVKKLDVIEETTCEV